MSNEFIQRVVLVKNREGLHARPAHLIAKTASSFQSSVEIVKAGEPVDGKSILSILTLAAEQGTELVVRARGVDAKAAVDAIEALFAGEFAMPGDAPPGDVRSTSL